MPTSKVKGLACNTNCSHLHKILVALHHKFTQYSVSCWRQLYVDAWIIRLGWTLVQQRLRLTLCTSNSAVYSRYFDIFTLDCSRSLVFFVYKTKATRPRPELQDQDQTCKTKTAAYETKASFCWSEIGLVTRPRSQTTSLALDMHCIHFQYGKLVISPSMIYAVVTDSNAARPSLYMSTNQLCCCKLQCVTGRW